MPTASVPTLKISAVSRSRISKPRPVGQANSATAGSPTQIPRTLSWSSQRNALPLASAETRARTLRKRTHTQPDHPSPVARIFPSAAAPEPPAATRRTPRPRAVLHPSFLFAALSRRHNSRRRDAESVHAIEQRLRAVGAPRRLRHGQLIHEKSRSQSTSAMASSRTS